MSGLRVLLLSLVYSLGAISSFAQDQLPDNVEELLITDFSQADSLLLNFADTTAIRFLNQLFEKYQPNRPDLAMGFAVLAYEKAQTVDYPLGIANSLNNIGVVNKNRGNYDKALEGYLEALNIFQQNNHLRGEGKTLSNIGIIYSSLNEPEKAFSYFRQADSIFSQLGDTIRLIGLYNNLGNAQFEMQQEDAALRYYFQALTLYNSLDVSGQSETPFNPYTNIGQVYFARQRFDSALFYYERSLLIERNQNRIDGEALALNNIGVVYQQTGKLEQALDYYNLALQLAPKLENNRILIRIYRGLVETYFAKGDLNLAYFYLNQESRLKDNLYQEQADRILDNIELNRQLSQKQNEIALLVKDNEIKDLKIDFNRITTFLLVMVILSALGVVLLFYLRNRQKEHAAKELEEQNRKIEEINRLVEEKNKHVTESIEYARHLQDAVVNKPIVSEAFASSFVFHRPKDIVSGDFYFFAKTERYEILAVADCTGHGVAGAFMTVIGNTLLNQIILEQKVTNPAKILYQLDEQLSNMLRQHDRKQLNRGMDIAIIRIDSRNQELIYSAAKRPLLYFRDREQRLFKGSRLSIGDEEYQKTFINETLSYLPGDVVYLYSDGYPDQFGGRIEKKYMHRRFREFLTEIHTLPLEDQLQAVDQEIMDWMGKYQEQTDDMMVVGIRF